MTLLKIARMGHPVLRRRADPVEDLADPRLRALIRDMAETMVDAEGVGLAAPQVHISSRLIVFTVPDHRREPGEPEGPVQVTALINPVIEPIGDEKVLGFEGCLSIPGVRGLVPRWRHIRYRGLAPDGSQIEREASGFHARVVQHEVDHLDGVLYLDRMEDLGSLAFDTEMDHVMRRYGHLLERDEAEDDLEEEYEDGEARG